MFVSVFILFLSFCWLSWFVIQQPDNAFDQNILIGFQNLHTPILTEIAKVLSILGGLPITVLFAGGVLWYGYLKKDRLLCCFVMLGVFFTTSTTWLLKWYVLRPRPFLETPLIETYGSSYPSAHSAYAMMVACILLYLSRDMQQRASFMGLALVWFLVMGCSRVYLGAHYLTDVMAGWTWAGFIMLLVKIGLDKYDVKQTRN